MSAGERRGARLQEGFSPEGKGMEPRPAAQRPSASAPPPKPADARSAAKPPSKGR